MSLPSRIWSTTFCTLTASWPVSPTRAAHSLTHLLNCSHMVRALGSVEIRPCSNMVCMAVAIPSDTILVGPPSSITLLPKGPFFEYAEIPSATSAGARDTRKSNRPRLVSSKVCMASWDRMAMKLFWNASACSTGSSI